MMAVCNGRLGEAKSKLDNSNAQLSDAQTKILELERKLKSTREQFQGKSLRSVQFEKDK